MGSRSHLRNTVRKKRVALQGHADARRGRSWAWRSDRRAKPIVGRYQEPTTAAPTLSGNTLARRARCDGRTVSGLSFSMAGHCLLRDRPMRRGAAGAAAADSSASAVAKGPAACSARRRFPTRMWRAYERRAIRRCRLPSSTIAVQRLAPTLASPASSLRRHQSSSKQRLQARSRRYTAAAAAAVSQQLPGNAAEAVDTNVVVQSLRCNRALPVQALQK